MNGDFSTLRFDKKKRFAKVMHQQGRVMTDADLNEASAIAAYFDETERIDVIGHTGTPAHDAAFGIVKPNGTPAQDTAWAQLSLTTGRYYVEGKMVELFAKANGSLPLLSQEITPEPAIGKYWAILEAFERYVSPTEDLDLIEEALRGPDTAGRTRVEWHVKLISAGGSTHCDDLVEYKPRTSFGTMSASAPTVTAASDPCETPNIGGFQGLENQLYRIEVHHGTGHAGGVSIKWSRENASLLSSIGLVDSAQKLVEVLQPGRDTKTGFQSAKFVEALNPADLHDAKSGIIAELMTSTDEQEVEIKAADWTADFGAKAVSGNYLRGWHGYITGVATGVPIAIDGKGVTITFGTGDLVEGDYWIIPARAITGNVIWPGPQGAKLQLPPFGTTRSYAVLGLFERTATNWTMLTDCRHIFYPLTEQQRFVYVSGDGQEAMPEFAITGDLTVGVVNGPAPVPNAKIQWSIVNGAIDIGLQENQTGANGMARLRVRKIQSEHVQIKAALLNSSGTVIQTPIIFNLNQSKASMVSYAPLAGCTTLTAKTTVQDALDRLASIRRMQLVGGDTQIAQHDPANANAFLTLPELLRVRVTSLCGPAANVTVSFEVVNGVAPYNPGALAEIAAEGSASFVTSLPVQTGADGIAVCQWRPTLGQAQPQRVRASFASDGFTGPEVIYFDYQSLAARDVSYDPGCTLLKDKNTTTVQQALDELCANLGQGGCEITVGDGGKFPDLLTAVEAVVKGKLLSVTLCLMPGTKPHVLNKLLVIDPKRPLKLEIHGGGPLMPLVISEGGISARGLGSFVLKNLSISIVDEKSTIDIVACTDVVIDHCEIERVPLVQKVPLVSALTNDNVRISDSTFDARVASWNNFLGQLARVKPKFSVLWDEDLRMEGPDLLKKRLTPFIELEGTELDAAKRGLTEALTKNQVKESPFVQAVGLWQDAVTNILGAKGATDLPQRIDRFAGQIGSAFDFLKLASGVGVILDSASDNWIVSNEFNCLVSFSGLPVPMNDDFFKNVVDDTLVKLKINIVGNGRTTHVAMNNIDAIVFGQSILDWVKTKPKAGSSVAWAQSVQVQGNSFRTTTTGLLGFVVHMTNDEFAGNIRGDAAWVFSDRFIAVGNIGFEGPIRHLLSTMVRYKPVNEISFSPP